MANQKRGSRNPIMSAFAANWIKTQRDNGKTLTEIGKMLGVSHVQAGNIEQKGVGLGTGTEANLALFLAFGSVDRLRKMAQDFWDEHPELHPNERPMLRVVTSAPVIPEDDDVIFERARACAIARELGYSEEAIEYARRMLPKVELTIEGWREIIAGAHALIKQGIDLVKL